MRIGSLFSGYFADVVVIEAPSFGSRGGQEHLRAGLWWLLVARLDGSRADRPIVRIPPSTLKKFATGKARRQPGGRRLAPSDQTAPRRRP